MSEENAQTAMTAPEVIDYAAYTDFTVSKPVRVPEYYSNHNLETFQKCPRKWLYEIGLRIVPKVAPRPLTFGAAVHRGLEVWYKVNIDKIDEETLRGIVEKIFDATGVNKSVKTMNRQALRTELMVYSALAELPPLHDSQATDRRDEVLLENMLRMYALRYDWEPFTVLDVEYSFTIILPSGKLYIGNVDLVIEWAEEVLPMEHKTTSSLWGFGDNFNPHQATTGYILGLKQAKPNSANRVVINALNIPKRKDKSVKEDDFARYPGITREESHLTEWIINVEKSIENVERTIASGYFPMNTNACFMCNLKGVCSSNVGAERAWVLQQHFEHKPFDQSSRQKAELIADIVGGH